jgi:Mlc titration factor MtfA (ptsG expression regulator)
MMPFFIIIGLIYLLFRFFPFLSDNIPFLQPFSRLSKEEQEALHEFYMQNFAYYKLLSEKEKRKFLVRITNIRNQNHLQISSEIKNQNSDVVLLISGAFAQITFGYNDYEITEFTKIIVNPGIFHSKLANHDVKGLTLGNGYIFYSWDDFIKGYKDGNDRVNLGLHELAHAIYIDRFRDTEDSDWGLWEFKAQTVLEAECHHQGTGFFRTYGQTNLHEFWAVSVECFFEDPITFKQQYTDLYQITTVILNQDMAERKMAQMQNN